ncbi:3-phosphoserine/phosphohydroxythreonine transaminase [Bacillus methanolicus]|uniref:phosphoserine transaminase n=1 Tax=Bacillus methanolicus TaxID=1471 RepID=UPI0023800234|nr:phosphoserine transaminase [Bacillus methanolicus]MDE3838131.1 3-phosphoserine/phosphohydroxythreonine transaminase [Bacillus methanolicus]
MNRAFNFNAGPAALPEAVLQKAANEWFNFNDTGMSLMELSHRSKDYEEVHFGAVSLLRKLMQIPDDYEVLLLQGGASLQFSMVPMNLLQPGKTGYYVLTGSWSEKALKEAKKIGQTSILASGKENNYKAIPDISGVQVQSDAAYVHITSNETIHGTQWHTFPKNLGAPLVADMSSDILSKPINVQDFGLIYAGAQKNLGPSGLTVVIIKKELLSRAKDELPVMLNYRTHAENDSLYNTPPTLAIYLFKLVLEWLESIGGVEKISELNEQKAKILYDVIDNSDGFYLGHADPESRSQMNVTFRLKSDEVTASFLAQAKEKGFIGLKGHRSIGGCRASIYNAVPLDHVAKLADFMKSFQKQY